MARAREKLPQIGFWDSEVALPSHDDICQWVYRNADFVLRTLHPELYDRSWCEKDFPSASGFTSEMGKAFLAANPRPNPQIFKKALEPVLKSYSGHNNNYERIVGYGDVLLTYYTPTVSHIYDPNILSNRDAVVGYQVGSEGYQLLVEAKTVLPTLGELMRQLNLYATAFGGKQAVISPDDSYADILREQGYGFMVYKPD
jgi:hypothetical protein